MRLARRFLATVATGAALVLAACGGGGDAGDPGPAPAPLAPPSSVEPPAAPAGTGTLRIEQTVTCCYTEGMLTFLRISPADGPRGEQQRIEPEFLDVTLFDGELPAGSYEVEIHQRPCSGSCASIDGTDSFLDAPVDGCDAVVELPPGGEVTLLARVSPYRGCLLGPAAPEDVAVAGAVLRGYDLESGELVLERRVGGTFTARPAVVGDVAYVPGEDGTSGVVRAIPLSGEGELWASEVAQPAELAVALDAVVANTLEGSGYVLVALDRASGQQRWRLALPFAIGHGPPVVGDGVVVRAGGSTDSSGGAVVAVEAATGSERWRVDVGGGVERGLAISKRLVVVAATNRLVALDVASGEERWSAPLGGAGQGALAVGKGVAVVGEPGAGSLAAFSLESGERLWTAQLPGVDSYEPAVTNDAVFVVGLGPEGAVLTALALADGKERWRHALRGAPLSSAVAAEGVVVTATSPEGLVAFDSATGDERWRVPPAPDAGGDFPFSSPVIADAIVYRTEQ